jgi:hypothetical protein
VRRFVVASSALLALFCQGVTMWLTIRHVRAEAAGGLSVQVQAALIAAFVSLLTVILSEFFLRMRTRHAAKQTIRETYQKYADPLAISTTALFWRLREAFDPRGGGFYLKGHVHLTKYEHYKALSTLYRIANLIGWIRALSRELLFLPEINPKEAKNLDFALQRFGSALAEGGHIETLRVKALIGLWGTGSDVMPDSIVSAGIQVDRQLKGFLHENGVSSASDLSYEDRLRVSRLLADLITKALGCERPSDTVIRETLDRGLIYLSVREAWIYRDWQAAIGDAMLREAEPGPRLFEVIGYKEFEALCNGGQESDRIWLRRLNAVIDDLDTLGDHLEDARIEQLWDVHIATAEMIRALHQVDAKRSKITPATLAAATETLRGETPA